MEVVIRSFVNAQLALGLDVSKCLVLVVSMVSPRPKIVVDPFWMKERICLARCLWCMLAVNVDKFVVGKNFCRVAKR